MSSSMDEAARVWHEEVTAGLRCYDCGKLYETPLTEDEDKQAKTDAEWAQQNPSHTRCFQ